MAGVRHGVDIRGFGTCMQIGYIGGHDDDDDDDDDFDEMTNLIFRE